MSSAYPRNRFRDIFIQSNPKDSFAHRTPFEEEEE
jgi:hypothetical protein